MEKKKNPLSSWVVVAHAFNPSPGKAEAGGSQSLRSVGHPVYRVSSKTARGTQRNLVSKTKQTNKQTKPLSKFL